MPTHKGDQWLAETLESVAGQAVAGIEVLVIDSSPTTATVDIARSFAGRIDVQVHERPDLLMWHAKTNFGVTIARAAHACWLHQDDLWLPGRADAARRWIDDDPAAALLLAPSAIVDNSGRTLGVWGCPLPTDGVAPAELVLERLLVQNFVSAPAPVFRTDAWRDSGGLDEELWYTADWDIWLKMAAIGHVRYREQVTTAFRIHGGSLTMTGSRDIKDFTNQMQVVLDRHLPRVKASSQRVRRAAATSIAVNTALASAATGNFGKLPRALLDLLGLGPAGLHRYFRDSRIVERVLPRLRANLQGSF
ncbi:glycosyltransferase [Sandarakinorhabdus sp. DWP1-3-1]|uniref:glycosyltransferase n=1 Tax=Sandarakinorhabdus sp. DWP1-3-1 TaxID=2804627 RepID=UPI003CE9740F